MNSHFRARPFDPGEDTTAVAEFLVRARTMVGHCGFYHLGDFSWNLFLAQLRGVGPEYLRLWEDSAGDLAGFAMYYPPSAVDIHSGPWLQGRERLETDILDWAEALREREPVKEGSERTLSVEVFEDDARFRALLNDRGYEQTDDHKVHMLWDLTAALPTPMLPDGYAIRPVADDELPARAEVQKAVWPWSRLSSETYPRLRRMPGYRPESDLICSAPDGQLVAFAICWFDETNRAGEFEPVGTHPDFRGKGLGKALMIEGLHRLKRLGATAALVYPTAGDTPAQRLYESAGFKPINCHYAFRRDWRGADATFSA